MAYVGLRWVPIWDVGGGDGGFVRVPYLNDISKIKYIEKDIKKHVPGAAWALVDTREPLRWPTLASTSSPSSAVPSLAYVEPCWPVLGLRGPTLGLVRF